MNGKQRTLPKGYFLNAVPIAEPGADGMIKIVPVGNFPRHPDGPHEVTRQNILEMAVNMKAAGADIMVDYGHESIWNVGAKAAGWFDRTTAEAREDGLYVKVPQLTTNAQQAVKDREYRYFSPVYLMDAQDKIGRKIGALVDSVALVNKPYLDTEIDQPFANSKKEDSSMQFTKEELEKLGLKEGATEEEINAAVRVKLFANTKQADPPEDPPAGDPGDDPAANSPVVKNLVKAVDALVKNSKTKVEADKKAAAEKLVDDAINVGKKILPADRDIWVNSALADFGNTKTRLDAIKANAAMPGSVTVQSDDEKKKERSGMRGSAIANCASFLKPKIAATRALRETIAN